MLWGSLTMVAVIRILLAVASLLLPLFVVASVAFWTLCGPLLLLLFLLLLLLLFAVL